MNSIRTSTKSIRHHIPSISLFLQPTIAINLVRTTNNLLRFHIILIKTLIQFDLVILPSPNSLARNLPKLK